MSCAISQKLTMRSVMFAARYNKRFLYCNICAIKNNGPCKAAYCCIHKCVDRVIGARLVASATHCCFRCIFPVAEFLWRFVSRNSRWRARVMFVEEALQGEKCNSWESNSGQIEDNDILCLPTTGAFFKKTGMTWL